VDVQLLQQDLKDSVMAKHGETRMSRPSDREMVFERVLDAPRELVFEVWTDPNHVGQWWGPDGFTTTTQAMDVRPGGRWRYIMHGPDGTEYPNLIVYIEVVKPERLVYSHGSGEEGDHHSDFQTTVTFEDQAGKTKVTMRGIFPSAEALEYVIKHFKADVGGQQTIARLAEYVAKRDRRSAAWPFLKMF
jgi:uncharacterized protein YndB with AHSA1/START domain